MGPGGMGPGAIDAGVASNADASGTEPFDAGVLDTVSDAGGADAARSLDGVDPGALPPTDKQLALGRAHACSLDLLISGLICWGDNGHGQASVPNLDDPNFVAAGGDVTCVVDDGMLRCFGDGTYAQTSVPPRLTATEVAVGARHVCALTEAGAVRCWGDDSYWQASPPALTAAYAIGAGERHSCALTDEGVRCWGDDALGQLNAPAVQHGSQLAVGTNHGCVIAAGRVTCWGGSVRALRDSATTGSRGVLAIAAGGSHNCAITTAGVECWGDSAARSLAPRDLTHPQQIAVGGSGDGAFACARHLQGVACWGDDSLGQMTYDGLPLHALYRSEVVIDASASVIWDVLADLDSYPMWNPYTIAMESAFKVGEPMVMTVRMNDLLTLSQTEYIRVIEPEYKMCWGIDTTTPELNSGERCQWLEPLPGGGTRYVTEDLIEGTLNPIVRGLFDTDLQVGFEGVAAGLKAYIEERRP